MFISIARDGRLALREVEDFKRLHIEPESTMSVEDVTMKALGYGIDRDRFFACDVLDVEQRIGEAV